jgi:hypothetical protein
VGGGYKGFTIDNAIGIPIQSITVIGTKSVRHGCAFIGCGTSVESGCCAVPAAWVSVDPEDGSEHRVNETEHSHLRYAI